jgi:hypothetical protein
MGSKGENKMMNIQRHGILSESAYAELAEFRIAEIPPAE